MWLKSTENFYPFNQINLLAGGIELTQGKMRILVVKAHPHDFTHCAGTLGIHKALGDDVTLVIATSGANTHNEKLASELLKPKDQQDSEIINAPLDEYATQKADELHKAAALFGIDDIRILNGSQPFRVDQNPDVVSQMVDIIDEIRPDILISQSPHLDGSSSHGLVSGYQGNDHLHTAYAIQEAQALLNIPQPGATRKPHTIAATFYPGVYYESGDWDFTVDISDWYEQRLEAEMLFESQGHTEPFSRKRIEISPGAVGWISGTAYAESFVRSKIELVPKITLSPYTLRAASEPSIEHLKRIGGELI